MRAVDVAQWLRPRPGDEALLAWKRDLLDDVGPLAFGALPEAQEAGGEVLALVAKIAAAGAGDAGGRHPLAAAARLVVEDLCVMDVRGPAPVLVGGAVAMPNRWRLADKLGRSMAGIHRPVPGYEQDIGTASDRLLQRLADGRVMARTNWALTDRPDLFLPADHSRVLEPIRLAGPADVGERLFVRVEYQTLRLLPASGAVLFTIRTARGPVGELAGHPDRAGDLRAVVEELPPQQAAYKGVAPYREPLLAYLRGIDTEGEQL